MKDFALDKIENLRILGRNVRNPLEGGKPLAVFWGASGIEFNVKSREVWIELSSSYEVFESYAAIFVNGYQIQRLAVPAEKTFICVARNLNPEKEYRIRILKDTQPMPDDKLHSMFIHSVRLSDDGIFCAQKEYTLRMEFIGDSITSGEGLAGMPDEGDWIPQWFCAGKTYAVQTADALDADFSVMSQCGWGICWGWNGDINSRLPPHYKNVCSIMKGDFQEKLGVMEEYKAAKPCDIVVVNLGTNDEGAFKQPAWTDSDGKTYVHKLEADGKIGAEDAAIIKNGVKNFLCQIRLVNPNAKIIWCWGMIGLNAVPSVIQQAIQEYKNENKDDFVYTLELDSMEKLEKCASDKGSRGHPGPKTHREAAAKLITFIQGMIN